MNWIPSEMLWKQPADRTMGVRVMSGGEVECLYYPPFIESISTEQLYGVIQHEIEHIVRCHCIRIGDRDAKIWNIAADMSVNGKQISPRIGFKDAKGNLVLPLEGNIIWIPSDWDADMTTEQYYELLIEQSPEDISGQLIDDHDIWSQSDSSADEIRQSIKNMVVDAVDKSSGSVPQHLEASIAALNQPTIEWRQLLRLYLGRYVGRRRYTYSRRNRRKRAFGTKGISKHATSDINIIVDVSGSITESELRQFFTEIESISHKCKIWLLLWDQQFRGYRQYRRGDWKSFSIIGSGGTDMIAPIEWLCKNDLVKSVQIMLTDGYCAFSDEKDFELISVITTNDVNTNKPSWGKIVYMHV